MVVSSQTVSYCIQLLVAAVTDWLVFHFDRVTVIGAGLFKLFIVFAVVSRIFYCICHLHTSCISQSFMEMRLARSSCDVFIIGVHVYITCC